MKSKQLAIISFKLERSDASASTLFRTILQLEIRTLSSLLVIILNSLMAQNTINIKSENTYSHSWTLSQFILQKGEIYVFQMSPIGLIDRGTTITFIVC